MNTTDMKGVFLFLANGFEEIEALATVDILRRGGIDVKTVSIGHDRTVKGAHGIPVIADWNRDEFDTSQIAGSGQEDVMIFPGGLPGAKNLADDYYLMETKILDATPYWFTRILSELSLYMTTFSKYGNLFRQEQNAFDAEAYLRHRLDNWKKTGEKSYV